MISEVISLQSGGRRFAGANFTKYSGFVGGNNSTYHSLQQFSPQVNGFGRLFMVRQPYVVAQYFGGAAVNARPDQYSTESEFTQFKHALEYYLAGFNGLGDINLENTGTSIQGGYAGREVRIPAVTKESTEQFTTRLYEFNGSLIASVVKTWMNMIADVNSGLATYGGMIAGGVKSSDPTQPLRLYQVNSAADWGVEYNESQHTAEFIYVLTDRSGAQVESAWLLADCYPKTISQSVVADMTPGQHDVVVYEIPWNCNVYQSPIITRIADDLLKRYLVISNVLNFNPLLGDALYDGNGKIDTGIAGEVPYDYASQTNIGNAPAITAFHNVVEPETITSQGVDTLKTDDGARSPAEENPEFGPMTGGGVFEEPPERVGSGE